MSAHEKAHSPLTVPVAQRASGTLLSLSDGWYWEQDRDERFTFVAGTALEASGFDAAAALIGRSWAAGGPPGVGECDVVRPPGQALRNFAPSLTDRAGAWRWLRASREPVFDEAGAFSGYRGVATDITDAVIAERLLRLEHAVTLCIAEAQTFALALQAVIRIVCESEGWDCGDYWALDEPAGVRRLLHSWCVDDPAIQRFRAQSRGMVLAADQGNVGKVFASGRPFWSADMTRNAATARAQYAREAGLRALFIWPISIGDKTLAAISFNTRKVREPSERLLQAFRVMGVQVGQFLQLKQAREVLLESEERFRSLTKLSSDSYWEQDEEHRFTLNSGIGAQGRELRRSRLIGRKRWEFESLNMTQADWVRHIAMLEAREPFRDFEVGRIDDDGAPIWHSISGEPMFDADGRFKGYRGVGKDITARKRAEERVQHLAHHDALTGLPNRVLFGELLHTAIELARRNGCTFAVMFIDLDRFKLINDTLGHEAGDELLKEAGLRLTKSVRASDVVARLGGDEFVVLAQESGDIAQLEIVARRILVALANPVFILGQECRVTASIGICAFPDGAQDEQGLMKNADIAMYQAKEAGKNNFQFFSPSTSAHSLGRLALETGLRKALVNGEFTLHYQAKLELRTQRVTGVEALLRWQHPDLGMIAPGQFIPLAEETGLIVPIGRWVLKAACEQSMAWQRQGMQALCMAVNLSARQLAGDSLVEDVARVLRETGLRADLLELELTESMIMRDIERTTKVLAAIKHLGVRLAIDDFGVGYSSLAHIKRFPIDTLKLDRSLIRDIAVNGDGNAIAEAIIAMGKTLSMTVVAEGVETQEQQSYLLQHACDEMQGFHFSKPITGADFSGFMRQHIASCRATRPGRADTT